MEKLPKQIMWEKEFLSVMPGLKNTKRLNLPIEKLEIIEWIDSYTDTEYWGKKNRLGFGVVSRLLPCSGLCKFCERRLESAVNQKLIPQRTSNNILISELVATGGFLGDPFLIRPSELGKLINDYVTRFPNTPCRINTTGNMFANKDLVKEAINEIRKSIPNTTIRIAVSVNQIKEDSYIKIMRPLDPKGSFDRLKIFVETIKELLGKQNILLTFIDYSNIAQKILRKKGWPYLNKHEILKTAPDMFGISEENIVFRKYQKTTV